MVRPAPVLDHWQQHTSAQLAPSNHLHHAGFYTAADAILPANTVSESRDALPGATETDQ